MGPARLLTHGCSMDTALGTDGTRQAPSVAPFEHHEAPAAVCERHAATIARLRVLQLSEVLETTARHAVTRDTAIDAAAKFNENKDNENEDGRSSSVGATTTVISLFTSVAVSTGPCFVGLATVIAVVSNWAF